MKLDYKPLYDAKINCIGDLNQLLDSPDGRAFGVPNASQMIRAMMRIDVKRCPEASREVLKECKNRLQHLAAGPLLYRVLELVDPEIDERVWLDELVDIMSVAYNHRSRAEIGIRAYLPLVPAGMLRFLEFRKSPNIEYFADKIVGETRTRLAKDILSHPTPQKGLDLKPMNTLLRQSIERTTDLTSWMKKNVPPHARKAMFDNTGYQEIIDLLGRDDRGKALEDVMGL
jgi:hypothetical protein